MYFQAQNMHSYLNRGSQKKSHTHTHSTTNSECTTVRRGEQRNALLLRGELSATQQVTALTRRHCAAHEKPCPPPLLDSHPALKLMSQLHMLENIHHI